MENARIDAGKLGFDKLYLCTDHTSYYEKYGWRYIAIGYHPWGGTSIIYEAPTIRKTSLAGMSDFFTARVDGYDEHMLNDVEGCKEGYIKMAELISDSTEMILDLGCGTGLELDEIFKWLPNVSVVGIDLTQAMLDKLRQKHFDTPDTIDNQIAMFKEAGFLSAEMVWRLENTTIIIAKK